VADGIRKYLDSTGGLGDPSDAVIDETTAADVLRGDLTFGPVPSGGVPAAHAASHQNGGSDEISVAGLSGTLADPQTPAAHTQAFSTITSTPTTLAGYGITDGMTHPQVMARGVFGGPF